MPANRYQSTRSTQDSGGGSAPGNNPTIIELGENIVSQSTGFDTRATTGGTANYNVGNSVITEGSDENWIEGLDNAIDGDSNLVIGTSNTIAGNNNQVYGYNHEVNHDFTTVLGNTAVTFADNSFLIGNKIPGIEKRDSSGWLYRTGAKGIFMTEEIDMKVLATYSYAMPSGGIFVPTYVSFITTALSAGNPAACIVRLGALGNPLTMPWNTIFGDNPVNTVQRYSGDFLIAGATITIQVTTASLSATYKGRFLIEGNLINL